MHKTAKRSAKAAAAGVLALTLALTGCGSGNNTNTGGKKIQPLEVTPVRQQPETTLHP
ncbi:hypothetical protein ACFTAO_15890 [Paenibacillus rhizoplanae]